jgi:hypothetical protein
VGWTGCVEPIGFPFRIGITSPIEKFAFDYEGKTLLTVSQNGILHAWKLDGSGFEMLPRAGLIEVFRDIKAGLGVHNGFVVPVRNGEMIQLVRYHLSDRRCEWLMDLGHGRLSDWNFWIFIASCHSIAGRGLDRNAFALDLGTKAQYWSNKPKQDPDAREARACHIAMRMGCAPPHIPVYHDYEANASYERALFSSRAGAIRITEADPDFQQGSSFKTKPLGPVSANDGWLVPMADGKPALAGMKISYAQRAGNVFAVMMNRDADDDDVPAPVAKDCVSTLRAFRLPDGVPLGEFSVLRPGAFLLSPDGRWLARQTAPNQVIVHEITRSPAPVFVTAKGRCHQDLYVEQGHHKMVVQIGNWLHLIRWDRGPLELAHTQGDRQAFLRKHLGGVEPRFPGKATRLPCMAYDSARFRYAVQGEVDVVVDVFGQLAVFDRAGTLVAMLFVFRNQIAAWLPDGTRYGPASIIGGPSTEGALEVMGRALRDACRREGRHA